MIYVEVVFVQLHMDHLLTFLVHFIFFQALVDLINLVSHFRLVFDTEKTFDLRLGCVEYLTRFDLMWRLVTQMEVNDGAADLN